MSRQSRSKAHLTSPTQGVERKIDSTKNPAKSVERKMDSIKPPAKSIERKSHSTTKPTQGVESEIHSIAQGIQSKPHSTKSIESKIDSPTTPFRPLSSQTLASLPEGPGVYEYYDETHTILYVGKAKNLKRRVKNYFLSNLSPNPKNSSRIQMMSAKVAFLKITLVANESAALILENAKIKQLAPRYNVLLRDDKTYPYIMLDLSLAYPALQIVREQRNKAARYFGPFTLGCRELKEAINLMLPLIQKRPSCIKEKKPCLFYQIERCCAPCSGQVASEDYHVLVGQALRYLERPSLLLRDLRARMYALSDELLFEAASKVKQLIAKLTPLKEIDIRSAKEANYDVFIGLCAKENALISKVFIRSGIIAGKEERYISLAHESIDAIMSRYILSYYEGGVLLAPDEILVEYEDDRLESALAPLFSKRVHVSAPKKGYKKRLLDLCLLNARATLEYHENRSLRDRATLEELANMLSCPPIGRIEVFDTSHQSGQNNVGGMIVYEDYNLARDEYRRYHLEGSDEYSQMRELLTRRASHFGGGGVNIVKSNLEKSEVGKNDSTNKANLVELKGKNPPKNSSSIPSLWLIDGGVAQLNLAREIVESSGYAIEVMAISKQKIRGRSYRAKGRAEDTLHTSLGALDVDSTHPIMLLMQALRDEAHRFAISFHKQKKTKNMVVSSWCEEHGISHFALKRLLNFYGSFEIIQEQPIDEIKAFLRRRKPDVKD